MLKTDGQPTKSIARSKQKKYITNGIILIFLCSQIWEHTH